jgi:type I restriction enzyme S subunit
MGQSPDGDTYNDSGDGMALINGPVEFDSYHPKRIKWTTQPTKSSQHGDLVVCVRGSTTGKFVKSDGIYCLGRGVCAIRAREQSWQPFVDQTYRFSLKTLLSLATGSTFPNWSGPTLKNYQILRPASDLIAAFSKLLNSVISQISTNELEIKSLATVRDTLLPKLLSGELSVETLAEPAGGA